METINRSATAAPASPPVLDSSTGKKERSASSLNEDLLTPSKKARTEIPDPTPAPIPQTEAEALKLISEDIAKEAETEPANVALVPSEAPCSTGLVVDEFGEQGNASGHQECPIVIDQDMDVKTCPGLEKTTETESKCASDASASAYAAKEAVEESDETLQKPQPDTDAVDVPCMTQPDPACKEDNV